MMPKLVLAQVTRAHIEKCLESRNEVVTHAARLALRTMDETGMSPQSAMAWIGDGMDLDEILMFEMEKMPEDLSSDPLME